MMHNRNHMEEQEQQQNPHQEEWELLARLTKIFISPCRPHPHCPHHFLHCQPGSPYRISAYHHTEIGNKYVNNNNKLKLVYQQQQ